MLDIALKMLETIEFNGFDAYIVGGFVRDYLLGIESSDIDICTNAEPKDIRNIFEDACLPNDDYGSVVVLSKNIKFEITTFRREISYVDNRKPMEYVYIDNLEDDLKRRDFTINTICMDKNKNIIDLLDGRKDLKNKQINIVGDSYSKFTEDSLRILRAVRFATILDFNLSDDIKDAIFKTKDLLKNLSYERKKEELDKIFGSIHANYGVKLLIELDLLDVLEIPKLKDIKYFDDLIGTWTLLDVLDIYPFTKNEKDMMEDINEVLELDNLDLLVLYKYGLYVNSVAGAIKGLNKKDIAYKYEKLPIKDRSEINITGDDIMNILSKKPGSYIKDILNDIEVNIITGNLENDYDKLKQYVENNWK